MIRSDPREIERAGAATVPTPQQPAARSASPALASPGQLHHCVLPRPAVNISRAAALSLTVLYPARASGEGHN